MAISFTKNPFTLTPAFNPVQFDVFESAPWSNVDYYILIWNDEYTNLPSQQFRKANVYNTSAFRLNFESTLQDSLIVGDPVIFNTKLNYTGQGWAKLYEGRVQSDAGTPFEFIRGGWVFNGSLDRNKWIDYNETDLIPNSATSSNGRFLSEFTERSVKFTSRGTSDVFNGSLESDVVYINDTDYLYTDYHDITYRNNNSEGQFTNDIMSVYDDDYGVRTLRLYTFPGAVADPSLAGGDIIQYTMNPASQAASYYGTSLDGQYTIKKISNFFNGTIGIYYVDIQVQDSVPTTNAITTGAFNALPDIGNLTLVKREWTIFNRYYENGYYNHAGFEEGDVITNTLNAYPYNKKLTFPSYPDTLRKSNGKGYNSSNFEAISGVNYVQVYVTEDISSYEIGDKIINFCQYPGSPVAGFDFNGEYTILNIQIGGGFSGENLVTFDCLFGPGNPINNFTSEGIIWNIDKDSLTKRVKRIVPAVLTFSGLGIFELTTPAENLLGVPDKFLVTIESGGPTYSLPDPMWIFDVPAFPATSNLNMTIRTRTTLDKLRGLTLADATDIFNNAPYNVNICIHHQIADNKGYTPVLSYDGSFDDPFYNNPVNSDVDTYEIDLEKIVDCDTIVSQTPINKLSFRLNKKCTKYEDIDIMWLNNYGAFDSATFDWIKRQSREYERESYRKTAGQWSGNNYVYGKSDKELTDYIITTDTVGTLNSDWIGENEYNRLLEILGSPTVYMYDNVGGYYLPIVIEMETIDEKTVRNDKLFNLELTYRVTYNQKSIRI